MYRRDVLVDVRRRAGDVIAILITTIVVAGVSQPFTGLDTPDSSFYLSLALHGEAITDRVPITSYYWTRIGHITGLGVFLELFGPSLGFQLYRTLLLGIVVASSYLALRIFTTRRSTIGLTALIATSSVILSYLGNPFHTQSAIAAVAVMVTAAIMTHTASSKRILISGFIAGISLGWLIMVSPYGAIMAGTLWLAITLHAAAGSTSTTTFLFKAATPAAIGAAATAAAFLLIGRVVFPQMDWLGSYLDANARIDYDIFASGEAVWLQDVSLLVPFIALVLTSYGWYRNRTSPPAQIALIIALTTTGFFFVYAPFMGNISLETGQYQSMLWQPMLLALSLTAASYLNRNQLCTNDLALLAIGLISVVIAGSAQTNIALPVGWLIAAGTIALAALFITKPVLGTLGAVILVAIVGQILQNARGDLGLYFHSPYAWAYANNPVEAKISTMVQAQDWVLQNTTHDDTVLTWVDGSWLEGDRELYAVAGMQLWGENRLTLANERDAFAQEQLERFQPTVIALYGPDEARLTQAAQAFTQVPTTPACKAYPWPASPVSAFPAEQAVVCLARLASPRQ